MFTHVTVGATDLDASRRFYDATFAALGIGAATVYPNGAGVWQTDHGLFVTCSPRDGRPASFANGGTIGFAAPDEAAVRAWHDAGVAHGGTSIEDPPGPRQGVLGNLYLAYLRDPAGNKLCAVHRLP